MPTNLRTTERAVLFEVVRFLLLCALLLALSISAVVLYYIQPVSSSGGEPDKLIHIQVGLTGKQIARSLAEAGVIRDADLFHLLLRVTGTDKRLQAGYYRLNPAMSIFEIMEQLQHGRTTATAVTIPEGFELRQIAARLRDQGLVDYNKFMELALDASKVFGDSPPLEIPIASLEGYLFPDTYRISYGQTEAEIIRQMVGRFSEVVLPAVEGMVGRWGLGLHEIITLASIVEREVMVDWERPLVASVFLNRLRINMPLQADPTVRYVMREDRSRVLYRDLEIDSPYNTYQNSGLPPGPIASPGLASIMAVLEPADTDYYYFVARGDGTHQFSRTFAEHVQARQQLGY
ncbi:MAG TPA: endolytic transglycosylase MltG [Firmicutes bacterium]|jgi:UPF0755 protein|nr:MAG: hypothetical protein AA931_01260 [Peptococcaceae bacterium 1109]HHT73084.1 endolytic transglycosylase MltG [Bacillota bacterium]